MKKLIAIMMLSALFVCFFSGFGANTSVDDRTPRPPIAFPVV